MNHFAQLRVLTALSFKSLPQRLGASSIVIVGIAAVVAVLLWMLTLADSLNRTVTAASRSDRAIVLSQGAELESNSVVRLPAIPTIEAAPGIRRTAQGEAIISTESMTLVRLRERSSNLRTIAAVRGISPLAWVLRPEIKLTAGRMYKAGLYEVIVGRAVHARYRGVDIGERISVRDNFWTVVGIFEAGGSVRESELLTDTRTLNRPAFMSVTVQLQSPDAFAAFRNALGSDPSLLLDAVRESDYVKRHSAVVTHLFKLIAYLVGGVMAAAATFGAVNTMYTAVSVRSVEMATLRAIGFAPGAVAMSVLAEALLLCLIGAVIGAGLVAIVLSGKTFHSGTLNVQLYLSTSLIATGAIWACGIGILGGLFPALRAARMPIATALREI